MGGMFTRSPVKGFLPTRAAAGTFFSLPTPLNWTSLPTAIASRMSRAVMRRSLRTSRLVYFVSSATTAMSSWYSIYAFAVAQE